MKYLIIGGNGQLGQAIKYKLDSRGHSVIVITATHSEKEYVSFMEECDFVFFLAFRAGGARYLKDKQFGYEFISSNIELMQNVFNALSISKKPFIYTSSQMSEMNYSAYGTLKRLAEFYTESLNGIYTRFWNIYGIEKNPERFHAICDFCSMAKKDGVIKMLTTGEEVRQFLYVEDAADALMVCLDNFEKFKSEKSLLDITNFQWVTMLSIAEMIGSLTGAKVIPATDTDWMQRDARIEPNIFILKYWQPKTSLETGLKEILKEI